MENWESTTDHLNQESTPSYSNEDCIDNIKESIIRSNKHKSDDLLAGHENFNVIYVMMYHKLVIFDSSRVHLFATTVCENLLNHFYFLSIQFPSKRSSAH